MSIDRNRPQGGNDTFEIIASSDEWLKKTDDWGQMAEEYRLRGALVLAYREPIVAMIARMSEYRHKDGDIVWRPVLDYISASPDGLTDSTNEELLEPTVQFLPAPANSYRVNFVVMEGPSDLFIEDVFEFGGNRGKYAAHIRRAIKAYEKRRKVTLGEVAP